MSWCSASSISVICSNRIKNITTRLAPTCHCTRMPRSRVLSRRWVACCPCRSWADYTTNTSECEFPTGTGVGVHAVHIVQFRGQFRHGDVRLGAHATDQELL